MVWVVHDPNRCQRCGEKGFVPFDPPALDVMGETIHGIGKRCRYCGATDVVYKKNSFSFFVSTVPIQWHPVGL